MFKQSKASLLKPFYFRCYWCKHKVDNKDLVIHNLHLFHKSCVMNYKYK